MGNHDNICALFPKLATSRALHSVQLAAAGASGGATLERRPMKLGVVLSGGQAPGEPQRRQLLRGMGSSCRSGSCWVVWALHRSLMHPLQAPCLLAWPGISHFQTRFLIWPSTSLITWLPAFPSAPHTVQAATT